MKKIIAVVFLFSLSLAVVSQVFERTYGSIDDDYAYCVSLCEDGNYLVTGYTTEFYSGYGDIYLLKLDQDGDTLWTQQEGEVYEIEKAYSVSPTLDQGCIVAGWRTNDWDSWPYVLKYDQDGNTEWIKDYGDIFDEGHAFFAMQSSDTTYAVCGSYIYSDESSDLWGQKVFVMSISLTGEMIWDISKGGPGVHYGSSMVQTADGGLVVGGMYDTQGEYTDAWLFKTNANGSNSWNKTIGGDQSTESCWDIKKTPDGGFIMLGSYFSGFILMNADFYLVKTDDYGNVEWSKTYGMPEEDDRGSSVDITNDGGYILCGETESYGAGNEDVWMIRTDENGDTLWTKTYGGIYSDGGKSVKSTPDGGFIIAGYTESFSNGGTDIYVIKTNFLGTQVSTTKHKTKNIQCEIYPNPVNNELTLKSESKLLSYDILNCNGLVVQSQLLGNQSSNSINVRISHLPHGVYTIIITTREGSVTRKFIIK